MSLSSTAPTAFRLARGASTTTLAVAAVTAAGFALRFAASGGPLWNDEIWSLRNLAPVRSIWEVLWGISHDNNHFLNSIWLYFAPIGATATWLRAPSILAGALAVPMMAYLGARRGAAAALAAAALTACSFFQFTYSVEARGYATATLALIVAFAALERALERPAGRSSWLLAAAGGLGFFSHLAMGPALALLGVVGFLEAWRRSGRVLASVLATWRTFRPMGVAMAPTLGFVVAGYLHKGGFTIGALRPYSAAHAIGAMVNLEMTTFGLDPNIRLLDAFALLALPCLLLAAVAFVAAPERRIAHGVFLFAIPAAVLILRPPNTHVARYFFAASPFLLLLAAETFDAAWRFRGARRAAACLALVAVLASDGLAIARMQMGKRAPWTEALATIAASGETTLASSFDFNVGKTVDYFNLTRSVKLDLVPTERICEKRPAWYIVEMPNGDPPSPEIALGGGSCRLGYALRGVYDENIPSQLPWALYRLRD